MKIKILDLILILPYFFKFSNFPYFIEGSTGLGAPLHQVLSTDFNIDASSKIMRGSA